MPKLINVPGVGRVPVPDDYTFDQILSLREQLQKKAGLEPDLTPQFGLGELASRGFERGLERTKIAFGDVIPAMVASGLGFADDYAKRQMEEAVASEQALQERLPAMYKSYEDIKSLGDVPGYAAETFGEVGPDILTSLIPGTIGAQFGKVAAQTAARQALAGAARQGLEREVAVKAAETAAERSATRGMLAGTYLGSYAQNTPEVFQSIYQETGRMEPAVAALYGGLSSALDFILPAKVLDQLGTVGKGALIREMVKESGADPKIWKTIGAGVAKGFVTEGVTETGQEFINNLAVKTLKENYDLFSPDNVTRYIDSFLRGAIVGGGVSLPSSAVEAVRERSLVKARETEEAAKVAEQQRVEAEAVAAQQKLEAQNQILSKIPEGIEPIRMGEDIFTVEQTGKAEDLIPQGYVVSGVQDRVVDTLSQATKLKDSMESTKDADIKQQEEERTKLIERLAKLDEELDRKQKDVINVSREDFETFRDKTYPEQANKLNEQIGIKDQILEALQKPIQIKPLEETKPRGANEFTAFKHTLEGRVPVSTGDTPDVARDLAFKQPEEVSAPPVSAPAVSANAPTVSANAPLVSADQTVSAEPSADLIAQEEVTGEPVEELRKELDRLGLPDVGVKLYNTLLGQGTPVDGAFTNQTISIAMNPTRSRIQTLHHEAIHAFKEAGLFTDSEWKALTTAAKKDWLKRKWPALQGKTVAELYSDMSPEIQIEEAIAVAFEHYMQKAFSPAGLVASAFKKLANFFGRIRNFFTGKGYQTADDVFDFVASGAMRYKIKPSEVSIGPTKFSKAPPVESEEFKRWFGDSKVVDDKGKPLVVYHGTNADFSIFEPTKIGEFGPAMYFSSSANDAAAYAGVKRRGQEEGAPNVIPVHLSIQNPYIKGVSAFWKEFGREGESDAQAIERVKAAGYDGIVETKSDWRDKQFKHYIVFDPTQVKSVYNVGTFDPGKKDIRFARNVIDISNQLEEKEDRELERYVTEGGVYSAMQMLTPQVRADIRKTLALADTALKDDGTIFFDQDREFADRFINNVTYVYDGLGRGDLDYAEIRTPALIKEAKELAKDLQTRIEEHIQHKQKGLKLVKFARSPLEGSEKFKQWFKDSKITEDGRPKVMYHGTSRDIESFRPKQANAIFLTDSPKFAEAFSLDSYAWLARHVDEWATPEIKAQVEKKAQELIRQDYKGRARAEILAQLKNREGEGLDYLTRAYQELVPVGPNLIPVYVSAQNPFDYENESHIEQLTPALAKAAKVEEGSTIHVRDIRLLKDGYWQFIEEPSIQEVIKAAGFDGFYVREGGQKNLAVYEPSQVKSVFNIGDFSIDDRRLSFARSPIADMQEKALEKIDAVQSKEASNGYNLAKSPVTAKQGMNVVNQFMAQSPTFGKQVVDKILDMGLDNKKLLYNFLTLEQLADVGKDILPEMTTYYETFQEMAGYRDKQLFAANKIAKELSDLSRAKPDQSELLADVAHSSTLASFDPDRPGTDKNPAITQMWNKLDPQAKTLYRKMRDFYENRYNTYYALLLQRIDSAITDKNKKAEINARLKKQFETAKVKGPYFPLARFGQYWVSYNDGVERFVMFENRSEAEKFKQSISHLKDVKAGLREERNLNMPIPNSVIKELIDTVDSAKNPTELKQDLWAAYLTMLPEVSMRKHFIPRKGTPGYSNDIVRVFAENTFHGAYNLARLKYAPQFEKSMDQMRERIGEANKKGEGAEPQELFNALLKRQEFILNPTPSSMFSNAAGILGFTWFLTAPASAITNLSQNATVAYPILGARFGFGKAMNEMLGASRLFMSSGERNLDEPFSMVRALEQRVKESSGADKKRYERELKAIEALMDNGTLSRTETMDLAQLTDKPSIVGTKLNTFMKWTAAMFHGAEVFNRSTTAYAAYRMAFDKTGDHEAAIKEASRLVRRSHFDYSASNKAPIAQGEYAKVIFMFKQYGMNMTYLLLREAQILGKHVIKRYKGTPLEQEAIDRAREARDTLVGIMGVTGLFSGVMGLPYPMYLMTMLIANALFGDEEDEVFDAETRFKLWLTDSLGASAADIIAKGPISYLTGADFSERVSMNGLIFREVGRLGAKQAEEQEQKEATLQWIADITGPLGGLAINFSKGLGAMSNGNVYQGIEMMIPLAVANAMKAIRYESEGVLTMKGDPIVEEVNTYQSFLRAIGYAPTEVARQLEENTAIRAVESQATMSRKRLLNRFALAVHQNDFDAIEDIEAAIEKFNEKYPGYEITGQTLTQSLRARDAASAETEHGLRINKRIRDVYERASRLNEE